MNFMSTNKRSENLIYLFIWFIIIAMPIFTMQGANSINWTRIFLDWIWIFPFIVIFVLNNSLLAPRLLFKKKNFQYLLFLTLSIIIITLLSDYTKYIKEYLVDGNQKHLENSSSFVSHFPNKRIPPAIGLNRLSFTSRLTNNLILSFLIVGFNIAVKFVFKRQLEDKINEEQKKMHIQSELSFLRQQISPHFFMNTLNNIHALVDINSENAKDSIIRLSDLMSYMLYESQTEKISIQKEMNFIRSYVELMRMRFPKEIDITLIIPSNLPKATIPPLLTISLIENAFKHGISYEENSFVHIRYVFTDYSMIVEIENTVHRATRNKTNSGIGLVNTRNRLNLIYGDNYELVISPSEERIYKIKLYLPL